MLSSVLLISRTGPRKSLRDAFSQVKKDKYKPLDARPNRHWTKVSNGIDISYICDTKTKQRDSAIKKILRFVQAMRLRLNKFERSQKTTKMIKCLRNKVSHSQRLLCWQRMTSALQSYDYCTPHATYDSCNSTKLALPSSGETPVCPII